MTDFVLQRLLDQLGQLLRANPQLYISVNLAACDVMVPRIGEVIADLLRVHRVSARQIAFEVTERGLIDVVVARDNLQALRNVGHQVLIDDFGTGYCSLAYLQTLPVDCLKIDKAFIDAWAMMPPAAAWRRISSAWPCVALAGDRRRYRVRAPGSAAQ
ncbi:EAL domain-containing protein [Pseudomonas sp. PCH446]